MGKSLIEIAKAVIQTEADSVLLLKNRIDQNIFITSYEPASNFNDSIQLFEIGELKLLNLNDAGINYKIADAVIPVDILFSTFGSGASGFPLCWTHLNSDDQFKILDRQFKSRIELLAKASKVYRTKYILPFASPIKQTCSGGFSQLLYASNI